MPNKPPTPLQQKIMKCSAQGMTVKDIAKELDCSESSVRHIRANEELNKRHKDDYKYSLVSAISLAIERTEEALLSQDIAVTEVLALGKQLQELARLQEGVAPREQLKLKIEYVTPDWKQDDRGEPDENGEI